MGNMAAIAHFISRCIDCLKPFFNVIKKAKTFEWIAECEEAFLAIKSYLISPLILKSPQLGDPLYMYLATSKLVVSAVLFKLGLDGSQLPIYYVSKTMFPAEQSYTLLEKAALTLWVALKKLRPYFWAHQVNVLTNVSFQAILHMPELSKWLVKWVVELSEFGLWYLPHLSLKGKVLVDFIAKWPDYEDCSNQKAMEWWILYVDEVSCNPP